MAGLNKEPDNGVDDAVEAACTDGFTVVKALLLIAAEVGWKAVLCVEECSNCSFVALLGVFVLLAAAFALALAKIKS